MQPAKMRRRRRSRYFETFTSLQRARPILQVLQLYLCAVAMGSALPQRGGAFPEKRQLKGGGCFSLDTLVTMADGSQRAIGEIQPGDMVRSWDPATAAPGWNGTISSVTSIHRKRQRRLLELELPTGDRLRSTIDHPYWSQRISQLVAGDPLVARENYGLGFDEPVAMMAEEEVFEDENGHPVTARLLGLDAIKPRPGNVLLFLEGTMIGEEATGDPMVGIGNNTEKEVKGEEDEEGEEVATLHLDPHPWFFASGVRVHNKGGSAGGDGELVKESETNNTVLILIVMFISVPVVCFLFFCLRVKTRQKSARSRVEELRTARSAADFAKGGRAGSLIEAVCPSEGSGSKVQVYDPSSGVSYAVLAPNGVQPGRPFQVHTGTCPVSGNWSGSYSERSAGLQLTSSYNLIFEAESGKISGEGRDADGSFPVQGAYNVETGKVAWGETYPNFQTECFGVLSRDGAGWRIDGHYVSTQGLTGFVSIASVGHLAVAPPSVVAPTANIDIQRVKSGEIPGLKRAHSSGEVLKALLTGGSIPKGPPHATKISPTEDNGGAVDLMWTGPLGGLEPGQDGSTEAPTNGACPKNQPTHLETSETAQELSGGLPPGWKAYRDPATNCPYYVKGRDKTTCTWANPAEG